MTRNPDPRNANAQDGAGVDALPIPSVLGWAFTIWLAMLLLPLVMFVFTAAQVEPAMNDTPKSASVLSIFVVIALCALIAAGVSFWHRRTFRKSWRDGVVPPSAFLRASVVLWAGLALAAIIPQIACIIEGTLFPHIVFAAIMMMTLTATWPKGRAMTRRRPQADEDDDDELGHLPSEDAPPDDERSSTDRADQRSAPQH